MEDTNIGLNSPYGLSNESFKLSSSKLKNNAISHSLQPLLVDDAREISESTADSLSTATKAPSNAVPKVSVPYYTRSEVAEHHTLKDLWVTWGGDVYNLTKLAQEYESKPEQIQSLRLNAGKDISHWFSGTSEIKTRVDPKTGLRIPCLEGAIPDLPPMRPCIELVPEKAPWWNDMTYWIGKLSMNPRCVRIVNTLTKDEVVIEACSEEPLHAIMKRYLKFNAHAKGYTWKYMGRVLDMGATLEENNIPCESHDMERIGMNEMDWLPALFLYYSDDLTIA